MSPAQCVHTRCHALQRPSKTRAAIRLGSRSRVYCHQQGSTGRQQIDALRCRSQQSSVQLDTEAAAAINEVSNQMLRAMLSGDERIAGEVSLQLGDMRAASLEYNDDNSARFLFVLQRMLAHELSASDAEGLEGPYAKAFDRICNQVAGSDWQLTHQGMHQPAEPRFSTWEEALHNRSHNSGNGDRGGSTAGNAANSHASQSTRGGPDNTYYQWLEVSRDASAAEIKMAFRKGALKLHPDVNPDPNAAAQFQQISTAYDALSDPDTRRLYDRFGVEGLRQRGSAAVGGTGNSRAAWDELKPFKRENKRTRARDSAASAAAAAAAAAKAAADSTAAVSSTASRGEAPAAGTHPGETDTRGRNDGRSPPEGLQPGAVVEFPLSDVVKSTLLDGRSHGLGLLVGRNMDRGDAGNLPPEALDLCEVEPLRHQEPGSTVWVPDELQASAYVRLGSLREVPVAAYDRRFDEWVIEAQLSDGCGSPDLGEDLML